MPVAASPRIYAPDCRSSSLPNAAPHFDRSESRPFGLSSMSESDDLEPTWDRFSWFGFRAVLNKLEFVNTAVPWFSFQREIVDRAVLSLKEPPRTKRESGHGRLF